MNLENQTNTVELFSSQSMSKSELGPDELCENLHISDNFQCLRFKSPFVANQVSMLLSEKTCTDENLSPGNFKSTKIRSSFRNNMRNKELLLQPRKSENLISEIDKKKMVSRFFKLMVLFYLVKKFIKKLKQITVSISFQQMEKNHFRVLNDPVFFKEGLEKKQYESIKSKILRKVMEPAENKFIKPLFHATRNLAYKMYRFHIYPTHKFILIWECIILLVTIFYFFIIPIDIAFGNYKDNFDKSFIMKTIYVFFLDIIVNFNTAFYSSGQLITSKAKICKNYFYGRFFSDLFSLTFLILTQIFNYSSDSWVIKAFAFTYLLRVKNLSRAISQFEDFLFCDEDSSNIVSFFHLLVNILLFSHWSACIWKIVGSSDEENGWLAYYHVINQSLLNQYIFSLYYVVVVTNTVGFGDIVAQNIVERIFTILFIYTACVIFAYTINRIGMIVQNINKKEFEFKRTMNTINGYMKIKNIGFELKIKIRNYLEYIWHAEKLQKNETQEIINRLSKTLKQELLLNANGFTLKKIPLFGDNFSDESLHNLVCEMKEINLTPEDIIYHENQTNDENMYIIRDGEVELSIPTLNNNKKIVLKVLKKGDCFGQISFFTGLPRNFTAKSVSFSSLFVINKETFISIVSQNSSDYERYCEIKDQISLYSEYDGIFYRCAACLKRFHPVQECPHLHLTLSRERVLAKYNYSVPQKKWLNWNRLRKVKHPNSLKLRNQYNMIARVFIDDLRKVDDNFETITNYEDDDLINNTLKNLDNEQEEDNKSKEKSVNSGKDLKEVYHKDNPGKLSHEEGSPGLKKNTEKWWFPFDNSTMDIDCIKNFDFYFPSKNMENLIVVINEMALKKQKKLKSFFPFSELWAGDKPKIITSLKKKKTISNEPKYRKKSILFLKKKPSNVPPETSLWNKIKRIIISIFT